ncbi:hypothetical protein [Acidovorax sp. SUPP2539]|uniref:hypothetical protein n=1 Tax=Acidovorax sp. SUPP2539 TaxID=2920878 RepID=UPI0023DE42E2|nr:hypothetical protein [Acidovorax sp. SUPP2539]GKS91586.1 hypothetical protein AVTE2539_19495 [Acidovorax sp. SUPP2539]
MAVEFFLIDAPHTVPVEHAAWQEALARWRIAADRVFNCESWDNSQFERLNHAAVEAKQEADRLEQIARAAWRTAPLGTPPVKPRPEGSL